MRWLADMHGWQIDVHAVPECSMGMYRGAVALDGVNGHQFEDFPREVEGIVFRNRTGIVWRDLSG